MFLRPYFVRASALYYKTLAYLLIKTTLPKILEKFILDCRKFDRFYLISAFEISATVESLFDVDGIQLKGSSNNSIHKFKRDEIENISFSSLAENVISKNFSFIETIEINNLVSLLFDYEYAIVNRKDVYDDFSSALIIEFDEKTYLVANKNENKRIHCLYSEVPTEQDISEIVKEETNEHKNHLAMLIDKTKQKHC